MNRTALILVCLILLSACTGHRQNKNDGKNSNTMIKDTLKQYGYNRDFLEKHVKVIELKKGKSVIALVPDWQGRVITSSAEGDQGFSFGWINHDLIASGKTQPHINAYGGEERLWLGPEGGQYSIYFKKGDPFEFEYWQTPDYLDTKAFSTISHNDSSALFGYDVETDNYSGTHFSFRLEREVAILGTTDIQRHLGIDVTGLNSVGYRSVNKLINKGENEWKKETGMLSVWMLGMFNPSPSVVVVIPFRQGDENVLGRPVNDNYFGKIASDRLIVTDSHIFFRADGKSRGKIGLPPLRATGTMGSFDFENNILTLLICRLPEGVTGYVNSSWQIQDNPFSGDALNSYNDGPLEDGSQMGPFYELETSSPAAALKPGEDLSHVQFTLHLTGDRKLLNKVSLSVLGVSLEDIRSVF